MGITDKDNIDHILTRICSELILFGNFFSIAFTVKVKDLAQLRAGILNRAIQKCTQDKYIVQTQGHGMQLWGMCICSLIDPPSPLSPVYLFLHVQVTWSFPSLSFLGFL